MLVLFNSINVCSYNLTQSAASRAPCRKGVALRSSERKKHSQQASEFIELYKSCPDWRQGYSSACLL